MHSRRSTDQWLNAGLASTLLVACSVAMINVSHPDKMRQKSAKDMLAMYDRTRNHPVPIAAQNTKDGTLTPSNVPLIFLAVRPFSAEFYSRGKAIKVISEADGWRRIGPDAAFVATRDGDKFLAEYGETAGVDAPARQVARLGRFGEFDLLFIAAR